MMRSCAGIGLLTAIVVILVIGRQKLIKPRRRNSARRSCLSSDKKNKTKKKVRFAADVVEPRDNNREYHGRCIPAKTDSETRSTCPPALGGIHALLQSVEKAEHNIPANRVAL